MLFDARRVNGTGEQRAGARLSGKPFVTFGGPCHLLKRDDPKGYRVASGGVKTSIQRSVVANRTVDVGMDFAKLRTSSFGTDVDNQRKPRSISTVSFMDEPSHTDELHPPVKLENTYQMSPLKRFPVSTVRHILQDVLQNYLQEEKYEPELCRQMTKTISEVIKARVKDLMVPRYKIICLIHIGQLNNQGLRIGSRCLWDPNNDTFATQDFQNGSLYAVATVYGVYYE
ncbi:tctex1 domain-containing protein 1-B-like isoform X1 [Branchiostoma floridae]|uniref:Tctex1 domain-containing protein 1-B-like isoform X1 n=1 Tax=Branchiostoma floridae TaxID=7739 RepID=A0A9J7MHT2_BRAFL|nr:tctex1 domain-containing protein 1-B-like isoform X1 [Branchiostoma floridae]